MQALAAAQAAAQHLQAAQPYGVRAQAVAAVALASAVYLHGFVRRLPRGSAAAWLAVAPIVALNVWLPSLFSRETEILTRLVMTLLTAWLGSFKALGLVCNRGPLASARWSLPQFTLLYLLPLIPRQEGPVKQGRLTDSAGTIVSVAAAFALHAVLLCCITYAIVAVPMPSLARYYITALGLYAFVMSIMNGPAAVLIGLTGLEVVPPFDKPWLSSSLADFWSRRWNNTVSLTLRSLIYDPVVSGRLVREEGGSHSGLKPSAARRAAGVAATFVVSGIIHEWILWHSTAAGTPSPFGYFLAFFSVQFPLLMLEDLVRRRLRGANVALARPLGIGWCTGALMLLACYFWYPPIERYTDIAPHVVASINANVLAALAQLQAAMAQLGLGDAAAALGAVLAGTPHAATR